MAKTTTVSKGNTTAHVFLAAMRDYNGSQSPGSPTRANALKRLVTLTEEKPEQTLAYLNGLPSGVEAQWETLRYLREVAMKAVLTRAEQAFNGN